MNLLSEPGAAVVNAAIRQQLPQARGPMSAALLRHLVGAGAERLRPITRWTGGPTSVLDDDDVQLCLHVIYELSYRGYDGVDDGFEWDEEVVALRRSLESDYEQELRRVVDEAELTGSGLSVDDVLGRFVGPSLSTHMESVGTLEQFREFAVHRSAYQLKEADPHSWALARVSGRRKAALVEIQSDEYGRGVVGHSHAELFAEVLTALDLDATYGAFVDRLPAATLATGNLISMMGLQFRLRAALLGHLAAFEMTSVRPMSRYLAAARRLGLDGRVQRFYDVHVRADEHHGALAADQLAGGDPWADGLDPAEILFGAAALLVVEDRFARHLLRRWARGESSLRSPSAWSSPTGAEANPRRVVARS